LNLTFSEGDEMMGWIHRTVREIGRESVPFKCRL